VPEQFRLDLEVEKTAVRTLNGAIELARSVGDNGPRELLEHMLGDEEEYANWLESQQALVAQVGEANYLAQQTAS
jgi:bacterioferritin